MNKATSLIRPHNKTTLVHVYVKAQIRIQLGFELIEPRIWTGLNQNSDLGQSRSYFITVINSEPRSSDQNFYLGWFRGESFN